MTDEPESDEVWIRDGETWFVDARETCKRLGGEYLTQTEGGDIFIGIPGKGELSLATLLAEEKADRGVPPDRSGTVVPIKPKGSQQ